MSKDVLERIEELVDEDIECSTIAWDKGVPNYYVVCGRKTFYVRNLNTWCDFYEINYQMLLRKLREGKGSYKGVQVTKL